MSPTPIHGIPALPPFPNYFERSQSANVAEPGAPCCDAALQLDVSPSPMVFSNWVPGHEYVKKVVIQNLSGSVTQKVTYRTPQSRFFFLPYPCVYNIPPGHCFSVDVLFRPTESIVIQEFIEFECARGSFRVPLSAVPAPRDPSRGKTHRQSSPLSRRDEERPLSSSREGRRITGGQLTSPPRRLLHGDALDVKILSSSHVAPKGIGNVSYRPASEQEAAYDIRLDAASDEPPSSPPPLLPVGRPSSRGAPSGEAPPLEGGALFAEGGALFARPGAPSTPFPLPRPATPEELIRQLRDVAPAPLRPPGGAQAAQAAQQQQQQQQQQGPFAAALAEGLLISAGGADAVAGAMAAPEELSTIDEGASASERPLRSSWASGLASHRSSTGSADEEAAPLPRPAGGPPPVPPEPAAIPGPSSSHPQAISRPPAPAEPPADVLSTPPPLHHTRHPAVPRLTLLPFDQIAAGRGGGPARHGSPAFYVSPVMERKVLAARAAARPSAGPASGGGSGLAGTRWGVGAAVGAGGAALTFVRPVPVPVPAAAELSPAPSPTPSSALDPASDPRSRSHPSTPPWKKTEANQRAARTANRAIIGSTVRPLVELGAAKVARLAQWSSYTHQTCVTARSSSPDGGMRPSRAASSGSPSPPPAGAIARPSPPPAAISPAPLLSRPLGSGPGPGLDDDADQDAPLRSAGDLSRLMGPESPHGAAQLTVALGASASQQQLQQPSEAASSGDAEPPLQASASRASLHAPRRVESPRLGPERGDGCPLPSASPPGLDPPQPGRPGAHTPLAGPAASAGGTIRSDSSLAVAATSLPLLSPRSAAAAPASSRHLRRTTRAIQGRPHADLNEVDASMVLLSPTAGSQPLAASPAADWAEVRRAPCRPPPTAHPSAEQLPANTRLYAPAPIRSRRGRPARSVSAPPARPAPARQLPRPAAPAAAAPGAGQAARPGRATAEPDAHAGLPSARSARRPQAPPRRSMSLALLLCGHLGAASSSLSNGALPHRPTHAAIVHKRARSARAPGTSISSARGLRSLPQSCLTTLHSTALLWAWAGPGRTQAARLGHAAASGGAPGPSIASLSTASLLAGSLGPPDRSASPGEPQPPSGPGASAFFSYQAVTGAPQPTPLAASSSAWLPRPGAVALTSPGGLTTPGGASARQPLHLSLPASAASRRSSPITPKTARLTASAAPSPARGRASSPRQGHIPTRGGRRLPRRGPRRRPGGAAAPAGMPPRAAQRPITSPRPPGRCRGPAGTHRPAPVPPQQPVPGCLRPSGLAPHRPAPKRRPQLVLVLVQAQGRPGTWLLGACRAAVFPPGGPRHPPEPRPRPRRQPRPPFRALDWPWSAPHPPRHPALRTALRTALRPALCTAHPLFILPDRLGPRISFSGQLGRPPSGAATAASSRPATPSSLPGGPLELDGWGAAASPSRHPRGGSASSLSAAVALAAPAAPQPPARTATAAPAGAVPQLLPPPSARGAGPQLAPPPVGRGSEAALSKFLEGLAPLLKKGPAPGPAVAISPRMGGPQQPAQPANSQPGPQQQVPQGHQGPQGAAPSAPAALGPCDGPPAGEVAEDVERREDASPPPPETDPEAAARPPSAVPPSPTPPPLRPSSLLAMPRASSSPSRPRAAPLAPPPTPEGPPPGGPPARAEAGPPAAVLSAANSGAALPKSVTPCHPSPAGRTASPPRVPSPTARRPATAAASTSASAAMLMASGGLSSSLGQAAFALPGGGAAAEGTEPPPWVPGGVRSHVSHPDHPRNYLNAPIPQSAPTPACPALSPAPAPCPCPLPPATALGVATVLRTPARCPPRAGPEVVHTVAPGSPTEAQPAGAQSPVLKIARRAVCHPRGRSPRHGAPVDEAERQLVMATFDHSDLMSLYMEQPPVPTKKERRDELLSSPEVVLSPSPISNKGKLFAALDSFAARSLTLRVERMQNPRDPALSARLAELGRSRIAIPDQPMPQTPVARPRSPPPRANPEDVRAVRQLVATTSQRHRDIADPAAAPTGERGSVPAPTAEEMEAMLLGMSPRRARARLLQHERPATAGGARRSHSSSPSPSPVPGARNRSPFYAPTSAQTMARYRDVSPRRDRDRDRDHQAPAAAPLETPPRPAAQAVALPGDLREEAGAAARGGEEADQLLTGVPTAWGGGPAAAAASWWAAPGADETAEPPPETAAPHASPRTARPARPQSCGPRIHGAARAASGRPSSGSPRRRLVPRVSIINPTSPPPSPRPPHPPTVGHHRPVTSPTKKPIPRTHTPQPQQQPPSPSRARPASPHQQGQGRPSSGGAAAGRPASPAHGPGRPAAEGERVVAQPEVRDGWAARPVRSATPGQRTRHAEAAHRPPSAKKGHPRAAPSGGEAAAPAPTPEAARGPSSLLPPAGGAAGPAVEPIVATASLLASLLHGTPSAVPLRVQDQTTAQLLAGILGGPTTPAGAAPPPSLRALKRMQASVYGPAPAGRPATSPAASSPGGSPSPSGSPQRVVAQATFPGVEAALEHQAPHMYHHTTPRSASNPRSSLGSIPPSTPETDGWAVPHPPTGPPHPPPHQPRVGAPSPPAMPRPERVDELMTATRLVQRVLHPPQPSPMSVPIPFTGHQARGTPEAPVVVMATARGGFVPGPGPAKSAPSTDGISPPRRRRTASPHVGGATR
ncbi:hypothetical protein PAPYR_7319 [Paratrimastix pyriformis]|uniref:MSP domain-containing protein n=1 Tax=Paratrimastix pyriformis TaxID=342808 RepID=A0ABQ8UKE8_9EUKA|nr:hypothetical protein PAPYR_7319 [Paratrimastix pyriformis]